MPITTKKVCCIFQPSSPFCIQFSVQKWFFSAYFEAAFRTIVLKVLNSQVCHTMKRRHEGYNLVEWQSHVHGLALPMKKRSQVWKEIKLRREGYNLLEWQSHGHGSVPRVKEVLKCTA